MIYIFTSILCTAKKYVPFQAADLNELQKAVLMLRYLE